MDLTGHWAGLTALAVFVLAYVLVLFGERLGLAKSKPVIIAAGLIWALVAIAGTERGAPEAAAIALRHNLLDFAEVFLFVLAAMTYVNTLEAIGVFGRLRHWLVSRGLSLRGMFWVTGAMAFFTSPVADNLTTALFTSAAVLAIGARHRALIVPGCINVVVAANAGGAFSPFGDITTLMVWQKGVVPFHEFFALFLPALLTWLIPAFLMSRAIPMERPRLQGDADRIGAPEAPGGALVLGLFALTIALSVLGHHLLRLPPVLGMMTGLGLLKLFGRRLPAADPIAAGDGRLDVLKVMARTEWDTLMFFYGIILCVGGLGAIGYLTLASSSLHGALGATGANVAIGVLSAVIDNIPLMFAVLTVDPAMDTGQWLLVTLTTGVGGSLLSIGSAAGVAVMGQAPGVYTFLAHLKWSWAIALGYAAGILAHLFLNAGYFTAAGP
jgi:Na+/H+ antiporter NhaD/arsenite permease-like protein